MRLRRHAQAAAVARERCGDVGNAQDQVDRAGLDRAARHAVVAGLVGVLRDDQAAVFLERPQAEAAVGAGARQDDADGAARRNPRPASAAGNRTAGARRGAPRGCDRSRLPSATER